jgi:Holliday junction resolvase
VTSAAKARGSQWERDIVGAFIDNGFPKAERRYGAGAQLDKGDIRGVSDDLVIEAKNLAKITLSTILDETQREKENAKAKMGVAIIKRRGKNPLQAYCVMSLEDLLYLLREAIT